MAESMVRPDDGKPLHIHCWHASQLRHVVYVDGGVHKDEACCFCGESRCVTVQLYDPGLHGPHLVGGFVNPKDSSFPRTDAPAPRPVVLSDDRGGPGDASPPRP